MNIQQAILKYRIQRALGRALLLGGAVFYFVASLLFIYHQGQKLMQGPITVGLGRLMVNGVADLYDATNPYIGFFWSNAPTLSQDDLFSYGNLLFVGLVGVMILGKQFLASGNELRRRVTKQMNHLEERQWRGASSNSGGANIAADRIGQVNIYQQQLPPSPHADWWTKPIGIVGLGIVSGYLVAVLAKITGML